MPIPQREGLVEAIDRALPQTQCTRCGYADCRAYAEALAADAADINRCPPGGAEGIRRLAALTGRPPAPLDPEAGLEGPRHVAVIDEAACIGCARCLPACPVDCIVGGPKSLHVVIEHLCTGCERCLPACPVDCIALVAVTGPRTGWNAWSADEARTARIRYEAHRHRLSGANADASEAGAALDAPLAEGRRRAIVEAALARARQTRR